MNVMARDIVEDMIVRDEIISSRKAFDMSTPLTEQEELLLANRFDVSETPRQVDTPRDLEDELYTFREPQAVTAPVSDPSSYGTEYQLYLRWQAIAAMVAHEDAWLAFQELVLLPFVQQRRQEDDGYTGHDRDKAFALRLRRLAADEFIRYIIAVSNDAGQVPKPSLMGKVK